MKNLFIFLLIALISAYSIKPTDKSKIWISAVLIPLISLVVYGLIMYLVKSSYFAGHEIAMSIIPAIISGIIIYFQGKKKIENENIVKFPIVLVIFIGISLIGTIVQYTLETKNRKFIQEYSKNNDLLNLDTYSKQEETTNEKSQLLSIVYNGVSFSYPDNWSLEKEVLQDELAFQINCEKKGYNSSEILAITWLKMELSPNEMILNTIEGMKEEPTHKNAVVGDVNNTSFKGLNSQSLDFTVTLMGETFYGRMTSFNSNGNTILMIKQSDSKTKLETDFKIMEESFEIK
ncbi:MAG: hypothetical protein EOL97_14750 [Spirochaetia bacterium]|nr:hypothetical protein [Spirochaetia bacterium]